MVDSTYIPNVEDKKADVNGRVETLTKILVGGDISILTMSEIIEKITSKLSDDELKKLAAELKKRCGCGGSVKDGNIEIQGEKRDLLKQLLEQKGFKVKLAGG